MDKSGLSRLAGLTLGVTAVAMVPGVALGQNQAPSKGQNTLEEVVVTALRREQGLQEVPAAISVLDASAINAKAAEDYRDYLTTIPGVNLTEGNLGQTQVTIRGVSDGLGASSPLTGIYFDETPVTQSLVGTFDPNVFDIDRVEVLRGPQGTLYGAASMGGTVRVITNKPELNTLEGELEGRLGFVEHGDDNRVVNGVINVPLVEDRMALRISGGIREDGGWIDDALRGLKDVNNIEKDHLRVQLRLDPGENTSVILAHMYQDEEFGVSPYRDIGQPEYTSARAFRTSGASEGRLTSLTIEQDWEWMTLTSATSYLTKDSNSTQDATASLRGLVGVFFPDLTLGPLEGLGLQTATEFSIFTQEIRLASSGHNRFDWVVGGFYSNDESEILQQFDFSQAPTLGPVATGADFLDSVLEFETRQIAAFGELTFNVNEVVSLTAGLRASDAQKQDSNVTFGLLGSGVPVLQKSDETSTIQKYLAEFRPADAHMIYLQASEGYRNGGPTGAGVPATVCDADLQALGYSSPPTSYDPDELWNYEIGSKNQFLDGSLTLNGALYYIEWSDIQTSLPLPSCGFTFVANSGEAEIKGGELEVALIPLDGLTLTGSVSYVDAVLKEAAPGTSSRDGDPLPLTAEWSGNVAANYSFGLTNGLIASLRGEINYVGSRWNTFASNPNAVEIDSYSILNVNFRVESNNWGVGLFATNLTDEHVVTYISSGASGHEVEAKPRVIGVEGKYHF